MSELVDRGAEEALLASVVFRPDLYHAAAKHASKDDFVDNISSVIFNAVGVLHLDDVKPDQVLIKDIASRMLSRSSMIRDPEDLIDGRIEHLKSVRFTPENVPEYAKRVRKLSWLRRIDQSLQGILSEVTPDASPEELASRAMQDLLNVSAETEGESIFHYSQMKDRYEDSLQEDIEYIERTGYLPGLRFGFAPVDDYTNGLRDQDLYILAGAPGAGKTSVAMSLLRRFALREMAKPREEQIGSLFVSLEMGEQSTSMRFSQMLAGLTTRELRAKPTRETLSKVKTNWGREREAPLWSLFAAGMKADELKSKIAFMKRKHDIKLVVIDHFGYLDIANKGASDNQADIEKIRFVKNEICKALNVSVILIAHTSKAHENREDKKPRMSDLSGSQRIAAEADYISFVYRPWELLTDAERSDPSTAYREHDAFLVYRKNRTDKLGDARFTFEGATMKVEDPFARDTIPRVPFSQQEGVF